MVNTCCAYNCKERFVKGSGITFHHFPRNEALRRKWAILVGRKNFTPTQSSKLCSKHFPLHCFENDAQCQASTIRRITKLKPDAVPSIFNFSIKKSREPPLDHGVKEKQRFPKSEELKNTWLTNIQRENFVPNKYTTLCSKHFTEDSFDTEKFGGHWLKQNAVPTVFDFSKPLRKKRKLHKSEKLDESSSSKSHSDESNEEPRQDHSPNESKPPDITRKHTLSTPSRKQRSAKLDDPLNEDKIPRACVVKDCDSHIGDDSKMFYRFPSLIGCNGKEFKNLCMLRRSKWIEAVKRGGITKKKFRNERICSNHFITGKPGGMTDKNDPDWVPTLNMGPHNTIKPSVIVHQQQQGSNPEMKLLFQNFITELQTTHTAPPIKRKSDCLANNNNNIDGDTSVKDTHKGAKVLHRRLGNKTGKPPITLQKKVNRLKNYTHSKSRQKEEVSEKILENAVVDSKMFRCFLCDKHLLVEGASSLSTLTDATKVPFRRKLDSMVADLVMGVTSNKDGLLCSSCARVLNHVDCLEDELSRLNKVLLNTLLRKYDLEHVIECTESPNNFIEEVHFTLKQNRTEIHAAEKLTDGSILDLKNATSYLTQVRKTVGKHSHLYSNYLAILKKFKSHSIDTCDVMEKVTDLFKGHPNLIVGFMRFLPSEYIVDVLCNEQANASPPLVNEDSLPDASEVSFKLDDDNHYDENENDHHDYSLSTSFLAQMDEDDIADDSTVCESLSVQNSATKRRAVSGHIYNKSSDQPVKNNNDNFAVPLQNNPDSDVVNGVVSPFNHIKNKCESIPSDNLMVPAIRQSKKSVISSITKRVTPTIVRVQENADILFGNHLVSVVRPRRKKSRFSQAIESIETEAFEPTLDKVVPGDATSDYCTENSVEVVLQNTNNCIKTLRSELVPTKRQQYYRAKSVVSMSYLDEVKFTFGSESQTYDDFLDIVYKFHTQSMNTPDFIDKLINLFKDHPKLIIEFNKYLPPSYKIEVLGFKPETLSDSIIPGLKHRVSSELKEDCQIRVITNPQSS